MRVAVWVFAAVAICAIASADSPTGTVVVSCNESDAELIVDGVLIPDRTPAVLTLPAGSHVIEARKPPLIAQKKSVDVLGQQQVKLRFDLVPPAPPPPLPPLTDVSLGSASGSGSAVPPQAGSGSALPPPATGSGSATPQVAVAPPPPPPPPPEHHCRQGGKEVPCPPEGPHCTRGGKPVSCATGKPLPPPSLAPPPPPVAPALATGSGAGSGSAAPVEPRAPTHPGNLIIATTVPHAIAYVDGVPVRDAPCELELEPGEHVIAVAAPGLIPLESVFRIDAKNRQRIELNPTVPRQRIDVPAR